MLLENISRRENSRSVVLMQLGGHDEVGMSPSGSRLRWK
jgi:hypothetical protein